jgi:hypothetical protein
MHKKYALKGLPGMAASCSDAGCFIRGFGFRKVQLVTLPHFPQRELLKSHLAFCHRIRGAQTRGYQPVLMIDLRPSPWGKLFDIPLRTVGHAQILTPWPIAFQFRRYRQVDGPLS